MMEEVLAEARRHLEWAGFDTDRLSPRELLKAIEENCPVGLIGWLLSRP